MMTYSQALNRASALCSQGEKGSSDIFDKAIEWGLSETEAAQLLEELISEKFIDDRRFAHAFVNDKFTYQNWGRIKIRYALRQKGIEDAIISEMMEEIIDPEAYLELCVRTLHTKANRMEVPLSQNDRARLFRFAMQRGFEPKIINQSIALVIETMLS